MGVCKGKDTQCHTCIIAMILFTVASSSASVESSATLHYTTTTGCPGNHVIVTCLALKTDVLKWIVMDQREIGFRSSNDVSDERRLSATDIIANLTMINCSNNITSCTMESLIVIPIQSNMGNLALSCQSNKNESERIIITTNDGDQCITMTDFPTMAPTTHHNITTGPEPLNSGFLARASFIAYLLTYTLTIII